MLGSLLLSGRSWEPLAGGFFFLGVLFLVWSYLRAPANRILRTSCAFLKLLGLAALAICLLDPLWTAQRARPGANYFAVVADNSEGMQIKDRGDSITRASLLTNLLAPQNANWLDELDKSFQIRRYYFDSHLQSTRDFGDLNFNGRSSSIGGALHTIADRFHGQPLAGVLLLTDGNATDLPDGKINAAGLPPVYSVVIGRDDTINDISIQKVAVSQTSFEDAPVSVQADILAGGYVGKDVVVQLFDQSGKLVQSQTERPRRDDETTAFRFQLRPEKPGISFYRLRASAENELGQFAKPETSSEATLANNSRVIIVDRGQGSHRILYVGGRPSWEFKFMNRALAEDSQVDLVALIRVARSEPKFQFRGRVGETSNPLFRGFTQTNEDTERYDQPVLVRLNTKDANELAGGFPKTADELYGYQAVILGDVESSFFTRDQMTLLQKFVSDRGGGLLMLGGAESFRRGQYDHTPIGEMLPVYLDSPGNTQPISDLHLRLTKEGWLQPWARLRDTEAGEKQRLESMPAFEAVNRIRDIKPGASVIAEVQDAGGKNYPALVTQRFGKGRVGALMIADLWRWGMQNAELHRDLDKSWRQMIRWLVADVPGRVEFQAVAKRDDPNQALDLQVRVRDKDFHPLDNATVKLTVYPLGDLATKTETRDPKLETESVSETNGVHLTAEPALSEAGLYEATYVPHAPGGYLAEAVVTDGSGVQVGRVRTGWSADPASEEFKSLKPNRALMEEIARQTGGEVIDASKLDAFAVGLPNRKAPVTETYSFPLWHEPLVFLFALACFAAEWGLRRWKGLA